MDDQDVSKLFKSDFVQNIDHLYLRFVGKRPLYIESMDFTLSTFPLKELYL